jgi:hypothetical protein
MECYMMSRERAAAVARALAAQHPKLAHVIDAQAVRIYCETDLRQNGKSLSAAQLDAAPPATLAALIDVEQLFGMRP